MNYLVLCCHAGLGNRIRSLISARRVARKLNRQLAVIWSLDSYHCLCPYDLLFDTPHFFVGSEFIQGVFQVYGIGEKPNFLPENSRFPSIVVMEENFFWVESDRGKEIWGQHGPFWADEGMRDELLKEFDELVPVEFISREGQVWADKNFRDEMIGVHIRREDNAWSNKHCSDEMFIEAIDDVVTHMPEAGILLATDGEESEAKIRKRYGRRVVSYPVRSLQRGQSAEAVQDAFIVMRLLSQTDIIVRSCSSSFSQCAAWFGRVPTIDVGVLEHEQQ